MAQAQRGGHDEHRFQRIVLDGVQEGTPKRFHDLRHTAASLLLGQGEDPRVIMEILGHSQIGTTMNVYAHVIPKLKEQAAARMGAVLGKVGAA